ncbi:MAG: DNA gyrase inhibitor YacG [Acidobacteriota bacterium]
MKRIRPRCPTCGTIVKKKDAYFPFCSERCRLIDLGRWATENYRIPGPPADTDKKEEEDAESEE